ncbi:MAG TPA: phosphoglycerate mutase [Ottowia sp.]|uniref:phosphoglycerate mutase n=1 Tax=Ottowia sp. TaxID=1898956 RepID=UPI002C5CA2C2|nr:phosphoglycerate mutase [Ottowia sp.]HMN20449.1 phosphoglycerate mutase [Ottowia sp.]
MPASDSAPPHLLVDGAALALPTGTTQPPLPELPELDALLARMRVVDTLEIEDDSPETPFELALARAHGLPGAAGHTPWAAFETGTVGTPCAWLVPCHWQMGMDSVTLADPDELLLDESEARALLAGLQPLLAEAGVRVQCERPDAWLAQGELLRGLTCWSLRRALQQPVTRGQLARTPDPAQHARLRRLQSELQMLLHNHPVNEAREQVGRWTVNALWIDGAGALAETHAPRAGVHGDTRLARPPAQASAEAHAAAWRALDAEAMAPLATRQRAGEKVRITLCGPRRAVTLATGHGLRHWIGTRIQPQRLAQLREGL